MKSVFLTLCLIAFGCNLQAQTKAEKDQEKIEKLIEDQKSEYINNIVTGFEELDEFQKHVLTQRLHTYYQEVQKIHTTDLKEFEKNSLINDLNATHFKDFEDMLGKEFVAKLVEKAKGDDKSDQKKKTKKKKNKRQKKDKN